jgi:hypothetical protein
LGPTLTAASITLSRAIVILDHETTIQKKKSPAHLHCRLSMLQRESSPASRGAFNSFGKPLILAKS